MPEAIKRMLVLIEDVRFRPANVASETGQILVQTDTRKYIDITGEKAYQQVALDILRARVTGEEPIIEPPLRPKPCEISQEAYQVLEEGTPEHTEAAKKISQATTDRIDYETNLKEYHAILTCVEQEDFGLAIALLESRKRLRGEGFEIQHLYDGYYEED